MGAWGYSLYENDSSCDVRDYFIRMVKETPEMDYNEAFGLVKEKFADKMTDVNVVMSLANLAITFTSLDDELLQTTLNFINKEMQEIHRWSDPDKRKAFLIDFEAYLKVSLPEK